MSKGEAFWLLIHSALGGNGSASTFGDSDGSVRALPVSQDQFAEPGALIPACCEAYRVMDRFCLLLPRDNDHLRQETLDGFFRWLGRDYESFIDAARNLENIEVLIELLGLSPPALIADFGCGSGLAYSSPAARGYTMFGIDSCPVMRELAGTRGMRTFSPNGLAATDIVVDGVMSSYVLHFGPEEQSLSHCWSRLRSGGIFAANVHKGQGLDRALDHFSHLKGRVLSVGLRAGMERHGIYLQIEKP